MNNKEDEQQQQEPVMVSRRLIGAPPSAAAMRCAAQDISKNERKRSIKIIDTEDSGDESATDATKAVDEEEEEMAAVEEEEGEEEIAAPTEKRRRRRKKRIRLTDSGLKAKRKAERRDKLMAERLARGETLDEDDNNNEDQDNLANLKEDNSKQQQQPKPKPRPPPESLSPFQLFCDNILRKLMIKDPEGYFANPVTLDEAPDYNDVIETPMDFSTIREKIENNTYAHIDEFRAHVDLISANAMTYNPPGSLFYLAAQKLELVTKYYFSQKYLIYLYYALPFGKLVPVERLGVELRSSNHQHKSRSEQVASREREKLRALIRDTMSPKECIDAAPRAIKNRLTARRPNCHIAYLDNRNGALALNVLTPLLTSEGGEQQQKQLKLGDWVKPLERGNPGICTPFEPRINLDIPISYTNPGPYASFAPQYDSTWSTLNKRDSDLLLSCYGDKDNVADVFALRQMVAGAGPMASSVVEEMLNELTEGEHRKTIAELEGKQTSAVENIKQPSSSNTVDGKLQKTGKLLEELASAQYKRLSRPPPITLSHVQSVDPEETQLGQQIAHQLGQQVRELEARPRDVVSSQAVHQALGLDADDFEVLSEFLEV